MNVKLSVGFNDGMHGCFFCLCLLLLSLLFYFFYTVTFMWIIEGWVYEIRPELGCNSENDTSSAPDSLPDATRNQTHTSRMADESTAADPPGRLHKPTDAT